MKKKQMISIVLKYQKKTHLLPYTSPKPQLVVYRSMHNNVVLRDPQHSMIMEAINMVI